MLHVTRRSCSVRQQRRHALLRKALLVASTTAEPVAMVDKLIGTATWLKIVWCIHDLCCCPGCDSLQLWVLSLGRHFHLCFQAGNLMSHIWLTTPDCKYHWLIDFTKSQMHAWWSALPSVERTNILSGLMMVQLKGQHRKGQGQPRGLSRVKLSPLYLSCNMAIQNQQLKNKQYQLSKGAKQWQSICYA